MREWGRQEERGTEKEEWEVEERKVEKKEERGGEGGRGKEEKKEELILKILEANFKGLKREKYRCHFFPVRYT